MIKGIMLKWLYRQPNAEAKADWNALISPKTDRVLSLHQQKQHIYTVLHMIANWINPADLIILKSPSQSVMKLLKITSLTHQYY